MTYKKDVVFIGGGHSHALVLRMWGMKPLPGVRLSLISPQVLTPYSGMLPGLIAGHYTLAQTHIDLRRLSGFAGARFIQAEVTGVDLQQRTLQFADRAPLGFDVLSINCGITPDLSQPGAATFALAVKPIAHFYPQWQALVARLKAMPGNTPVQHLAVVGGGAAGVELILAIQFALNQHADINMPLHFHLIQQGYGLPENYPRRLQQTMAALFKARCIHVHEGCNVLEITATSVVTDQGVMPMHSVFWCTHAKASAWPQASGLAVDSHGFITLNDQLQSLSHACVFAAGDIAHQVNHPRPKAGVYAVRQAPVLYQNLRRYVQQKNLIRYRPQRSFLSLLACGDRFALARPKTQRPMLSGRWVWRWKDRIDRRFMALFEDFPPMPNNTPIDDSMHCGGCGAKVGAHILHRVLRTLQPYPSEDVILGLATPDDAAVIRPPADKLLVQSVDVFRALLDDPYVLGQIAAHHALSDLFAMHAQAHSALAIVTLPYASADIIARDLLQLMSGALNVLNQHQCALIGGHTSEGPELSIGFSVNGFASPQTLLNKSQLPLGHDLILTQGLGIGTLFAAHTQLKAQGLWIERAIQAMLQSNHDAATILSEHAATACTDVTGFGLLGHVLAMLQTSAASATIQLSDLPLLPGAKACVQQGIYSTLQAQNQVAQSAIVNAADYVLHPHYALLFDPQTSGGLLAAVAPERTPSCLQALHQSGYEQACVVGRITASASTESSIRLT